jgi:hypothetical protein
MYTIYNLLLSVAASERCFQRHHPSAAIYSWAHLVTDKAKVKELDSTNDVAFALCTCSVCDDIME